MADWREHYKKHLVDVKQVAKEIKAGDVIWMGQGPEIPYTMLDEIHANKENYHDIIFLYNVSTAPFDMLFDHEGKKHYRLISFFNLPFERMSGEMGIQEYHSCGYDHMDDGAFAYGCNTIALHVCPPDEDGYCNVGHYGVSTSSLIVHDPRVKKRIGFMDSTGHYPIPGDHKDVSIHISEFDFIVECDTEVFEIPPSPPTQVDKDIAAHILPHIKQGDKLQVGWGGLGDEILKNLKDAGPLEVYTEVACDVMVDLIEEGILTKVQASSPGACSERFFQFLSTDSRIKLLPRNKMIELFAVAAQENIFAINCTLMVDLLGQACSESQGMKPYSGAGGSFAYIYGAMRSKGGRSFLCLRSTYIDDDGNRQTCVVPWLPEGAIVTTPKNAQMYIVTEHGVADVYLKTMKDRVRALIKIAHPDYRLELKEKILTTPYMFEDDFDGVELFS
ncbi:MAG: hypothetical protein GX025_08315 [Clostridiales bacterium]|nr:hypothetical protein [Clostridiales bacterium]